MRLPRLIYLVDDDADFQFLVQQVFDLFLPQYRVRLFGDGADLVDVLDGVATSVDDLPGLIVLDVDMPRLDGFQTLAQLKRHPQWQSVPVVIMTNRTDLDYQQQSYQLGASAFVLKPMDLMAIKSLMTLLCEYEGDFSDFLASYQRSQVT
ncbi:response regulator [Fibrella forsythiae]|uniref:Response regulator n=1 Tax=Fibrella forsythiae TaxID=2817061 RepID=A0ABS3JSE6_9BACT|nr:response regulator [Fibrella forsythiae]MBO0952942.1 response regulator [Fibrella forsythiae]